MLPLLSLSLAAFKVCGHFCGPGWCNNDWRSEDHDASNFCGPDYGDVEHAIWPFSNPSCSDECCRDHDRCCAPDDDSTSGCNAEITACMAKCTLEYDMICTNNDLPVPPAAIMTAMGLASWMCCGHPCATVEAELEANRTFAELPRDVREFYTANVNETITKAVPQQEAA